MVTGKITVSTFRTIHEVTNILHTGTVKITTQNYNCSALESLSLNFARLQVVNRKLSDNCNVLTHGLVRNDLFTLPRGCNFNTISLQQVGMDHFGIMLLK